ncbi:hypothetical protein [Thermospira aquatica]|uniref:DUF1444 family protein n=1 Tax=Thermospira aquatica TaxID=2828656 RepID=A0AAX3BC33_9SPIR|nr:hypothetical protein [Thermospira aquatica]URA09790.1 hypothetical protein KDW03_09925 [Thermospira aquatica]
MTLEELHLSKAGKLLLKEALNYVKSEYKKFGRIRTRFYYPESEEKASYIELRAFIDDIIKTHNLPFPFTDRDSDYAILVNEKFFQVVMMQIHRMYPKSYLLVTQRDPLTVIFVIRDTEEYQAENIKLVWNPEKPSLPEVSTVPMHFTLRDLA